MDGKRHNTCDERLHDLGTPSHTPTHTVIWLKHSEQWSLSFLRSELFTVIQDRYIRGAQLNATAQSHEVSYGSFFFINRVIPLWNRSPENVSCNSVDGFKESGRPLGVGTPRDETLIFRWELICWVCYCTSYFVFQKQKDAALEATDTGRQHTDLDARVVGSQIFVLCTLNCTTEQFFVDRPTENMHSYWVVRTTDCYWKFWFVAGSGDLVCEILSFRRWDEKLSK